MPRKKKQTTPLDKVAIFGVKYLKNCFFALILLGVNNIYYKYPLSKDFEYIWLIGMVLLIVRTKEDWSKKW